MRLPSGFQVRLLGGHATGSTHVAIVVVVVGDWDGVMSPSGGVERGGWNCWKGRDGARGISGVVVAVLCKAVKCSS